MLRLTAQEELVLCTTVQWTLHHEKVGQYWMNVLDDKESLMEPRTCAVEVLSKMRYRAAIPILIRNILFTDFAPRSPRDLDEQFPVPRALGQYGHAAVPDIINAYLNAPIDSEPDGDLGARATRQRRGFIEAVKTGRTESFAITYLTGLHAQGDKRVTDEILQEFTDKLKQPPQ